MLEKSYKAFVVEEIEPKKFVRTIKALNTKDLPSNDVLIKVLYSALNYKDALSARGHKGITRRYPHTPGIDAAGIIEESDSPLFHVGEEVLVTGYDLGMNTYGGFGQYIRVPNEWIVRKPENMSLRETMIYGTAGFTASLCLYELQKHEIYPKNGKILVTGATGGVGSLAVGMLAKAGYSVIASTKKIIQKEYLEKLGASEVILNTDVFDTSHRTLLDKRWLGAIDTVGGNTLSTVIRSTEHRGAVCCLGLVESDKLDITVYPFLLRGITLIGIDSAERPMYIRQEIWDKISTDWRIDNPDFIVKEVGLEELNDEIEIILIGGQVGKVIINLWK